MSSAVVPDVVTWSEVELNDLGGLFQPQQFHVLPKRALGTVVPAFICGPMGDGNT